MRKGGGIYIIIGVLLVFLVVDAGVATWLLTPPLKRQYVVQPGETLSDIASRYRVHEPTLRQENGLRPGDLVHPGQLLSVPMAALAVFLHWQLQLVGLASTLVGVLLGFWLCWLSALVLRGFVPRVLGVTAAVAVINYLVFQASSASLTPSISPVFAVSCLLQGFALATMVNLLAKALGVLPSSA